MSYEYTSPRGNKITICESAAPGLIWAAIEDVNGRSSGANINNADVPTVAAELLKAAGQESVIVPKSKEEVATKGFGDLECGNGRETSYGNINDNPNWHRRRAANSIAIAECLEAAAAREAAEKAEAEAAEKKLQERQAAVLKELGHSYTYDQLGRYAPMRKAVDRIIELATILEDGASRD